MSEQLEVPAAPRKRRSHAERSSETQSRIKTAVVEAISELGFQRTTAAEISRRAGVSWGAA
ncbi:MAG: TetR/AcrR family transcriptional regulator, partial [bacterium]|nr:TetR/AcrR family transcriptional regulator [bacterium]